VSTELLLKGVAVGFAMAIPVGPVALTCIRQTLSAGRRVGFVCGLGAATADAIYAFLGACALKAVTRWLVREQLWLNIAGGLMLIYLGARMMRRRETRPLAESPSAQHALTHYVSTLVLALTNPLTLLVFTAVFAGFDLALGAEYTASAMLALGVLGGSTLWWLLMTYIAERIRPHIHNGLMSRINRWCGGAVLGAGIFTMTAHMLARL